MRHPAKIRERAPRVEGGESITCTAPRGGRCARATARILCAGAANLCLGCFPACSAGKSPPAPPRWTSTRLPSSSAVSRRRERSSRFGLARSIQKPLCRYCAQKHAPLGGSKRGREASKNAPRGRSASRSRRARHSAEKDACGAGTPAAEQRPRQPGTAAGSLRAVAPSWARAGGWRVLPTASGLPPALHRAPFASSGSGSRLSVSASRLPHDTSRTT